MKSASVSVVLVSFGLALTGAASDSVTDEAWINAPRNEVGLRLEDWLRFFGSDYVIQELESSQNLYSGDPMVRFWVTDGATTAHFSVNLVTNDHYLFEVESVSSEFMELLGMDNLPVDKDGNVTLRHCWDAGCNDLRMHKDDSGKLSGVWTYYWD